MNPSWLPLAFLTAACALFLQVHLAHVFQTLAGSDFSREAQSERERTFLNLSAIRFAADQHRGAAPVGHSPTLTALLADLDEAIGVPVLRAPSRAFNLPTADPLLTSDLDTHGLVTMAGKGDASQ